MLEPNEEGNRGNVYFKSTADVSKYLKHFDGAIICGVKVYALPH